MMTLRSHMIIAALVASAPLLHADNGTIRINEDPQLTNIVYANKNTPIKNMDEAVSVNGYRVQIYSSNNAKKAKEEAFELQKTLQKMYPEMLTHVSYAAPFWKVRIGDFASYFSALTFSRRLQEEMPRYATEIFVIKDDNTNPIRFSEVKEPE